MNRLILAFALLAGTVAPLAAADVGGAVAVAPPAADGAVVVSGAGWVAATRPVFVRSAPSALSAFLQPVARNERVAVPACLSDYSWCRVIAGGLPGWLAGADLAYVEDGRSWTLAEAGPAIGIVLTSGDGAE